MKKTGGQTHETTRENTLEKRMKNADRQQGSSSVLSRRFSARPHTHLVAPKYHGRPKIIVLTMNFQGNNHDFQRKNLLFLLSEWLH